MITTIQYEERDGAKVVVGFGKLMIDPMATRRAAADSVDPAKRKKLQDAEISLRDALDKDLRDPAVRAAVGAAEAVYQQAKGDCDRDFTKFCNEQPVHFPPRRNEMVVDSQLMARIAAIISDGKLATVEGEIYSDGTDPDTD